MSDQEKDNENDNDSGLQTKFPVNLHPDDLESEDALQRACGDGMKFDPDAEIDRRNEP